MQAIPRQRVAISALVLLAALARTGAAAPQPESPPPTPSAVLSTPRPESPPPPAAGHAPEHCAACRLASRTTGTLPAGAWTLESRPLSNGVALHVTSADPAVRDTLWKATLARGELIAALRSGETVDLCSSCDAQRGAISGVEIAARRTTDGLLLVYTSVDPQIVQRLHELVRTSDLSPRF
jgi:glucose/arabinose dehydrogenase